MKNNLNLLLAAIFMIAFLVLWDTFVMSRYRSPQSRLDRPAASSVGGNAENSTGAPSAFSQGDLSATVNSSAVSGKEVLTILETPDAKVSLLSRGARAASWQIKERDHWIELLEPEKSRAISPLETFPALNFSVEKKSDHEATFTARKPDGVLIAKTLRLWAQPPFHEITLFFSNPTPNEATVDTLLPWGNGIDKHVVGNPYDRKEEGSVAAETRAVGLPASRQAGVGARVKSWRPGLLYQRTIDLFDQGPFEWVGIDNNHFLAAFIGVGNNIPGVRVVADRKFPPLAALPINVVLRPGETRSQTYQLYIGPKNYSELKKLGHNLDRSVDFGMFGFISKALLVGLRFFKSITGNYGWAIILLTFCIQILVFPLTRKNLQHSVRMKELQPHLKKLQEQYKDDPKRLQVETFNFYKKNGMKFMGMEGCFPMLLQIPVFFAFYSTLRVAYELRGAPWIFWIHDLGVHDPYYVLPIIMGAGMFLQQKLTAVAADPAQARMMLFMPLMFTFMFLKLPAGLVLYWCVNSLTTIVIQRFLRHPSDPQPA